MTEKEIMRELKKLEDKRTKYMQKNDLVHVIQMDTMIRQLHDRIDVIYQEERSSLSEILKDQPSDVCDRFEVNTLLLTTLTEIIDNTLIEVNCDLEKLMPGMRLNTTDIIKDMRSQTGKLLRLFESASNAETFSDFCDLAQTLTPILQRKAEEHIAWIQNDEHTKINYADE